MPVPAAAVAVAVIFLILLILAGCVRGWIWVIVRARQGDVWPAQQPRRPVPWNLFAILGVVVLYYFLGRAIVAGMAPGANERAPAVAQAEPAPGEPRAEPEPDPDGPKLSPRGQIVRVSVLNLALLAFVPLSLYLTSGARWADLGLGIEGLPRGVSQGLFGCLLAMPPCLLIFQQLQRFWPPEQHPVQKMIQGDGASGVAALALMSAAILAPAAEELLFRGILLPWLAQVLGRWDRPGRSEDVMGAEFRMADDSPEVLFAGQAESSSFDTMSVAPWARTNPRADLHANLATSLLFAGLHAAQWPAPIPLFFLSMALGWITLRTGRLWPAITMHACFNAFSTLLLLVSLWLAARVG